MIKYSEFVKVVTSEYSMIGESFLSRLKELEENGINISRFFTGYTGLASEYGELFQICIDHRTSEDSPGYTIGEVFHIHRELGDILWYVVHLCESLGLDFEKTLEISEGFLGEKSKDVYVTFDDMELFRVMNYRVTQIIELSKKILFQGREFNLLEFSENIQEFMNALVLFCYASGKSPTEIIEVNKEKLSSRYQNKVFTVEESEKRKIGDI